MKISSIALTFLGFVIAETNASKNLRSADDAEVRKFQSTPEELIEQCIASTSGTQFDERKEDIDDVIAIDETIFDDSGKIGTTFVPLPFGDLFSVDNTPLAGIPGPLGTAFASNN